MESKYRLNVKITRDATTEETIRFRAPAKIIRSVNLKNRIRRVYDQGDIGSCTANALCSACNLVNPSFDPSRLFLYYNCRWMDQVYEGDNDVSVDDGTTLRGGINALRKYGVCLEPQCPYIESRFAEKPSPEAYTQALDYQVIQFKAIRQNLKEMKACLASGFPFVFGIQVYSSSFSSRSGAIPLPRRTERSLGGHALLCVGYDDSRQVFHFLNSWGTSWGTGGYGTIPYRYLTDIKQAGDFWTVNQIETGPDSKVKAKPFNDSMLLTFSSTISRTNSYSKGIRPRRRGFSGR